jgi:type II secretory pathway pseudopilin PulG
MNSDRNPAAASRPARVYFKTLIGTLVVAALAVTLYSIYVAVHEPDPQETVVLGQTKLAAGGPAGLRIVVRNRVSGTPVRGATVEINVIPKSGSSIHLGTFQTDADGSVADPLNIPDLPPGEYRLVLEATSSLGRDQVSQKIEIQQPAQVLLSSDKPIYQPGQTIHLRSLVLNSRNQKPSTNEAVTFEISDPKGNKVFKDTKKTSGFGIASADFVLADELNLGRYEIRVLSGVANVMRTVEVKRYVLPKFRLQISTDKPYYLPGETVSGSVMADYFFGKSVANGTVKLSVATLEEKPVVISELQGHTDASGKNLFHFTLPDVFAGMPQKNEQAFLDLAAEVRDGAGHAEEKTLSLTVSPYPLQVTAIPEAGALVPGVENILYVLTTYPDGRPAVCHVLVDRVAHETDSQGLCKVTMPPTNVMAPINIEAADASGNRRALTYRSDTNRAAPTFLLRSDKAIYQAGDAARINVLSTEKSDTIYLDAIKDGQTVLTKSISLHDHQAQYALNLPPSLVGTLELNAYVITSTGEDRGCSRVIYVNPASGLHIDAKLSQTKYRPGETARLDFAVTDAEGKPTAAALGIAAVDESVFALAENRPGLLKQLLDVESDLLKPRYQIKCFDTPSDFLDSGNQDLASAYFASLEEKHTGPTVEELINGGYLPPKVIEFARNMRGTPAYEKYRLDPSYAPMIRLLEGGQGAYNLREATGLIKVQAAEAHRQKYFRGLREYLQIGFLTLLFLSPVFLLIYFARLGVGQQAVVDDPAVARYVKLVGSTHNILAVLTMLPMICYPAGFFLADQAGNDNPAWVLLGFETTIVIVALLSQYVRLAGAPADHLKQETLRLRVFLGAFLAQFVFSRLGFVLGSSDPSGFEGIIFLWGLGSIAAPLFVLGALGTHVRRQLQALNVKARVGRVSIIEVLVILSILFVLAAMLLPALAKAKSRAMSISLLNDLKQMDLATQVMSSDNPTQGNAAPRVRRDFPETLLWRPELITDDHGRATLDIPLADSITTWRASVDGVSASGKLGSIETPITVFQDFFVDLDLPIEMSLGDEISVPVTCYNYLKEPQDVQLTVAVGDWFRPASSHLSVHLASGEVRSVLLPMEVLRVGCHALRVTAQGTKMSDAIEREARVVPTGQSVEHTRNDFLKDTFSDTFTVPPDAIPDSQSLCLKFYPSRFSEVVEGMDSVFQEPHGCFEQTSSTTYPNVLALDYLKRTGRLTPETQIKAQKLINAGYQRLLTFEVPGGGFEWFGRTPAHAGLTAYGILEFTDMNRVHPVDQTMVDRTVHWLYSQQKPDGSWDWTQGLDEWGMNSPVTAYVAWALAESGDKSTGLEKAFGYLRAHPDRLVNNYQKALAANAFLAADRKDAFGRELISQLKGAAITDKQMFHWISAGHSMTYSHDEGMEIETTALCAMAMMKAGEWPESVKQALTWISKQKRYDGTWGSTQGTILAIRALIAGSSSSLGQQSESSISVLMNGESIETFKINKDNSDVMKLVSLTKHLRAGENRLELRQVPAGELPVQVAGGYWLPARSGAAHTVSRPSEILQIDVQYDRTTLSVNDSLKCAVTVKNNAAQTVNMAIVDLGIPPGFDVDTSAFETMQQDNRLEKFEVTGNQIILYLRHLSNTAPLQFTYTLRAKYPVRVQTPASSVYEYYQPENRAMSKPVLLQTVQPNGDNPKS